MEDGPADFSFVNFHIANMGSTPAWIKEIECAFQKAGTPISDLSECALNRLRWETGSILPPGKDSKPIVERIAGGLPVARAEIASGGDAVFLRFVAIVKYEDVFGRDRRRAVCQRFISGLGWVLHGPPELTYRT